MSIFEIIIGAVFLIVVGISLGIAIDRMVSRYASRELDQKTWERIEGWRK